MEEVRTQEPTVEEVRTQEPIVEDVILEDYVSSGEDAEQDKGQEDESAPSDGQLFYDDDGIDTAYETEYDVQSSEDAGFDLNEEEVVPKVDDVSFVDGVFDGAFGGDGEEDFVIREGVRRKLEWNPWKWKKNGEDDCEDDE
ncbi:hypothetical protein Tco_0103161 [Tanacetum coccineum]